MPQKILFFSNLFPSEAFPHKATFNRQQFELLSKEYEVDIVVPVSWLDWWKYKFKTPQKIGDLSVSYFPYFYTPGFGRRFYSLFMMYSIIMFKKRVFKQRYNAVLASWAFPDAVAMGKLAKRKNIPYFIKIHGSDINMHCEIAVRRQQVVDAMRSSAGVLSVSSALKERLISFGVPKDKISTIYNGVNKERFYPLSDIDVRKKLSLPKGKKVILFVGNLLATKGVLDLIEAYKEVLTEGGAEIPVLIFIGGGVEQEKLESEGRLLQEVYPSADIRVVGKVEHSALNHWFNAADFVCLPSHNEGVPNVLLESMSCGTPVIASKVGGIPEIVPEYAGVLFDAQNIDALKDSLVEALSRTWNSEKIIEHSNKFDWELNIRQVKEMITKGL